VTKSEKTRRYRARQRAGIAVFRVRAPAYEMIEALIQAQRITVADALHRDRVEGALAEVAMEWAKHWLKEIV